MEKNLAHHRYDAWRNAPDLDKNLAQELLAIDGDSSAIEDRFSREIAFGTGGLRGVLGAGTNRMNLHTVARVTKGLADYLFTRSPAPRCAIAYDSRNGSRSFARATASLLANQGIAVFLYPEIAPTPMLSFAVRQLQCHGGVVITASHNPAQYNGYKVYDSTGCQVTDATAQEIQVHIQQASYFGHVINTFDEFLEQGKIHWIDSTVNQAYYAAVQAQSVRPHKTTLRIAYSPLFGAGAVPVKIILEQQQGTEVLMVTEQEQPNGDFPTAPYPNPEKKEALSLVTAHMLHHNADLALATDPDCDRIGVVVHHHQQPVNLTGDQIGVLLLDYLCQRRKELGTMPVFPLVIKTIVTTPMAEAIATFHAVTLIDVLTGFKYIGEQIGQLETKGQAENFIFGFEESCGYLAGSYVRDKDAVLAALLLCEMAGYYKEQGNTLIDALQSLYETHGYYQSKLLTFAFEGLHGMEQMSKIMNTLRTEQNLFPESLRIEQEIDYLSPHTNLPPSNVIAYHLSEKQLVTVRPSGTEPQLKIYLSAQGKTSQKAQEKITTLEDTWNKIIRLLS